VDANVKRFLEESKGLDSEPPFSMTMDEAAAYKRGSEDLDIYKRAFMDAVRGCANLQSILDEKRAVIQQQADELNRLGQENYELRMQLFEREELA
jgi:hypothetical protein